MKKISYRPARKEDLTATAEIYIRCLRQDYSFKPQDYLEQLNPDKEMVECFSWKEVDPENNLIFVASAGEKIVGYVSTGINEEEPKEYRGELTGLFVDPDYRGLGLGLGLMQVAAKAFLNLNLEKFVVYNYHRSAANKFYRGLGGIVLRNEMQNPGGLPLLTDIFGFESKDLLQILDEKISGEEKL